MNFTTWSFFVIPYVLFFIGMDKYICRIKKNSATCTCIFLFHFLQLLLISALYKCLGVTVLRLKKRKRRRRKMKSSFANCLVMMEDLLSLSTWQGGLSGWPAGCRWGTSLTWPGQPPSSFHMMGSICGDFLVSLYGVKLTSIPLRVRTHPSITLNDDQS